jgi:Mrp family chromosome partitioning ATPase
VVDGALLVCRAKASTRGVAARSRDLLLRVNAHVLGAILNAARVRRGGYFREQFRTFYEYQQESLEADRSRRALPTEREKKRDEEGSGAEKDGDSARTSADDGTGSS